MFANHAANIIMSTALISVFLGIFFFTYAASVERKIVESRTTEIINEITNVAKTNIPEKQKLIIQKEILPHLVVPKSLEEEDAKVALNNKNLLISSIKAISAIVLFCILILVALKYFYKVPLLELLKENLITLFFIALTEFIFLTYFAQNYITIDANFVKEKVLESLIEFGRN